MRSNKRRKRDFNNLSAQYTHMGLNPVRGFSFRSPVQVWALLVGLPLITSTGAITAFIVGTLVWPVALFIAAALAAVSAYFIGATFSWLQFRGWGAAIMDIEHQRRKSESYGERIDTL